MPIKGLQKLVKKQIAKRAKRAMPVTIVKRHKKKSAGSPSSYFGFPSNKVVKMRYVTTKLLDASTLGAASYKFSANGIYDPDITDTGHQPSGYDQWGVFYNHYVVLGSKITVQFNYGQSANSAPIIASVYLADDTTVSADTLVLLEQGKCSYRLMSTNANNSGPYRVNSRFSAKKFYNVKDVKDNLDRLGAPWAQAPADSTVYNVAIQTYNSTSNTNAIVTALITIDYIVLLSEPKELAQS